MIKLAKYLALGVVTCYLLSGFNSFAQTKAQIKTAKRLFEGSWVNKKARRHLSILFDTESYATINDWHGKWSQNNNTIDVYKAYIDQGKLVMPEDKTDLRCPYCEIVKKGDALLYQCRGMNTRDKRFVDRSLFKKEKN